MPTAFSLLGGSLCPHKKKNIVVLIDFGNFPRKPVVEFALIQIATLFLHVIVVQHNGNQQSNSIFIIHKNIIFFLRSNGFTAGYQITTD